MRLGACGVARSLTVCLVLCVCVCDRACWNRNFLSILQSIVLTSERPALLSRKNMFDPNNAEESQSTRKYVELDKIDPYAALLAWYKQQCSSGPIPEEKQVKKKLITICKEMRDMMRRERFDTEPDRVARLRFVCRGSEEQPSFVWPRGAKQVQVLVPSTGDRSKLERIGAVEAIQQKRIDVIDMSCVELKKDKPNETPDLPLGGSDNMDLLPDSPEAKRDEQASAPVHVSEQAEAHLIAELNRENAELNRENAELRAALFERDQRIRDQAQRIDDQALLIRELQRRLEQMHIQQSQGSSTQSVPHSDAND